MATRKQCCAKLEAVLRPHVETAERALRMATFPLALDDGSDAAYGYRFLLCYDELRERIATRKTNDALCRAFQLGALLASAYLEPAAFNVDSMSAATKARQDRSREWKSVVAQLAREMDEQRPGRSDARLAGLIRRRLEKDGGDHLPRVRTIRRYLKNR